jgi:lysozyme family protein
MADFEKAYKITMKHEGKYSNHPNDTGGETYMGIARNHHRNWPGWLIVDESKSVSQFPRNLESNNKLTTLVKGFYKKNYWDPIWGDRLPDQNIANKVFDIAVNMGIRTSVRFLQASLNLLNRNQRNYNDISEDGVFGNNTLAAVNDCLYLNDTNYLSKLISLHQGSHYINIMKNNPTQQVFARGWLNRVEL